MLRKFRIGINGKEYIVEMEELTESPLVMPPSNAQAEIPAPVSTKPLEPQITKPVPVPVPVKTGEGTIIESPMPGTILDIKVNVGDKVDVEQCLVIFEAMKMENEIVAPKAGTIAAIHTSKGSAIDAGAPIITIV